MRASRRQESDLNSAAQRTRLAWTRTALAFGAIGAAIVRTNLAAGLIVLAFTPVIWGLGAIASASPENALSAWRLRLIAVAVMLVAAVAFGIAIQLGRQDAVNEPGSPGGNQEQVQIVTDHRPRVAGPSPAVDCEVRVESCRHLDAGPPEAVQEQRTRRQRKQPEST